MTTALRIALVAAALWTPAASQPTSQPKVQLRRIDSRAARWNAALARAAAHR